MMSLLPSVKSRLFNDVLLLLSFKQSELDTLFAWSDFTNKLEEIEIIVFEQAQTFLTEKQYKVFDLIFVKNYSQAETAKILQINQSAVSRYITGQKKNNSYQGGIQTRIADFIKNNTQTKQILSILQNLAND